MIDTFLHILPWLTFVVILFIGVPLYFVLGLTCLVYFLVNDIAPFMILQRVFVGLNSFVVLAVPMFLLAGSFMQTGGTLNRLVKFAETLVGHLRGGMAHVNVVASMFFAGITGNATADVAALGPLEIAMMTSQGYQKDFATAVTVSSASIGPIIPPSMPMVMYGVVVNVSIGSLFLAGVIPGIIMGLALIIQIYFIAKKEKFPVGTRPALAIFIKEFINALGPLGLPLVILLGIYTGQFTPTEAAAIACLYAFILGKFVYRELKWKDIPKVFIETGINLSAACAIFAIAGCFSYIIALENIPAKIAQLLLSITSNKILLLLLINLALLVIGCFMEGISAILITAPILLPAAVKMGIDPVHFGLIMVVNLTLGLLTPPVGISLYIASAFTGLPVLRIARKTMPFFLTLLICLLIFTIFPGFSMWLPTVLLKKG